MKKQVIEVDEPVAAALKVRAAELGVSVSDLVAELVSSEVEVDAVDPTDIAELDRIWNGVKNGDATIPNSKVVRWLRTWGTSDFRPWLKQ
jgi:plasmid stability protein